MEKFEVQEHLDWKEPEIWLESDDGEWDITISKDEVEIEHNWDHGWGGRGKEEISMSRKEFQELINKFDKLTDHDN